MNSGLTNIEKITVLSKLVVNMTDSGISWYEHEEETLFGFSKSLQLEEYLRELANKYEIRFTCGGDGFSAAFILYYNPNICKFFLEEIRELYSNLEGTHFQLVKTLHPIAYAGTAHGVPVDHSLNNSNQMAENLIKKVNAQEEKIRNMSGNISQLNERYNSVINFNPAQISNKLKVLNSDISNIIETASNNELLNSLLPTINELKNYSEDIETINNSYREVYLNILKPIRDGSKHSIKTTVRWAIIGIITTTIVSIFINTVGMSLWQG